jgi:ATP-dependent Clp protease, protease subunit
MVKYTSKNLYRNDENDEIVAPVPISNLGEDLAPSDKSNKIFLYEEISDHAVLKIRKQIDKKVLTHRKYLLENDIPIDSEINNPFHIKLYINSYGGSVSDAFNLYDYIKRCPIPIYTYVEGIAASAATIISVSGKLKFMTPNSVLMIHQISSWFGGKYEEFKDEKANLDLFMEMIKNIYLDNTKLKLRSLNNMLKKDVYLNSKKCLEYGFVDSII